MSPPTARSDSRPCHGTRTAHPEFPIPQGRRWRLGSALLMLCMFTLAVPGPADAEISGPRSLEASAPLVEIGPLPEDLLAEATTLLSAEFWAGRVLDRLAPEAPLRETPDAQWVRLATIAAIPLVGIALLLVFVWARIPWRVRRARMDPQRFTHRVLNEPPEVVATRLLGTPPADAFAQMLERLEQQDRLGIEILIPATATTPARVLLRLRADPDTLHPVEQQVLGTLFGESTELRSDLHRARHHEGGFDPEELTSEILMRGAFPSSGRWVGHRPSGLLAGLLLASGLAWALLELRHGTQDLWVLALGLVATGVVFLFTPRRWWHAARGAIAAWRWLLPLGLATLLALMLHLLPPEPLTPSAGAALSLLLLSGFLFALASTRGFDPVIEHCHRMQQARKWARRELRGSAPSATLAWRRHLHALGLTREFEAWVERQGHDLKADAAATLPEDWSAAFHVPPAGDDLIPV
jgi:hypothetical protein